MTTLKCRNCGGTVELDTELPVAFCPYCGHQSLVEPGALGKVLTERERTKQVTIRENQRSKRQSKEKHASIIIAIIENVHDIALGLLLILLFSWIIYMASCH